MSPHPSPSVQLHPAETKISHWSNAPAEWFFSMRSMIKLDVNWLKNPGWKMVRLSLMYSSSPHVILSYQWWYSIIMCNWYHKWSVHICTCDVPADVSCIHSEYISIKGHYVWKVIMPLAHWHPQYIRRATSLNDPRSTEQAYRQKRVWPRRISQTWCENHAKIGQYRWTQNQVKQCNDTGMLASKK